jgi:hypothetical protein|tara:strand:- start:694 stop:3135 length:2442 start_codon:yes stop_codon:yes gene_type:complete
MSVFSNNLLLGAGGQSTTATFNSGLIPKSIWLDGSADYLTRTPGSAGDRTRWTLAWWFQLNAIATDMTFFSANDGTNDFYIRMDGTSNQNMTIVDNNASMNVNTTAMQRDTAWYHCIISYDSNESSESDRIKIYINGVVQALDTPGDAYPSSGGETYWNNAQANEIGRRSRTSSSYANAYMAQICFLNGDSIQNGDVAVTDFLDSFTFGTNGSEFSPKSDSDITSLASTAGGTSFMLSFDDSSDLGNDESSNNNDFSLSSIASGNQSTNTPSKMYPTINYIDHSDDTLPTLSAGNLTSAGPGAERACMRVTLGIPTTGKWYWEANWDSVASARVGFAESSSFLDATCGGTALSWGMQNDGKVVNDDTEGSALFSWSTNDRIAMAYDADNSKFWFGRIASGATTVTWASSGDPAGGTNATVTSVPSNITPALDTNTGTVSLKFPSSTWNLASVPSGFGEITSSEFTAPTYQGIDYFNTVLYTGNGTAIGSGGKANTGTGFQPDFVWIKNRDAADSHALYDAVRGTTKQIESDTTAAQTTESEGLTAFGSDGFTVGNLDQVNTNTEKFVSWQWLGGNSTSTNENGATNSTTSVAGADHFSIVSYTGTGSNTTIGHGLGAAPEMVIVRELPGGDDWNVYHADADSSPASGSLRLDSTAAFASDATLWNNTVPSSTIVNLGTSAETNQSSTAMIAYCFRSVDGVCKIGKYTGNNSVDGPFVFTGFKVAYVLIKNTASTNPWMVYDAARDTYNPVVRYLQPNDNAAGASGSGSRDIDFLADGFKLRENDSDMNGTTAYIYMAMADIGGGGTLPPIYGR